MAPLDSPVSARWLIGARNAEAEARLQKELGIPSLVAAILVQRDLADPAAAYKFLNPSLDDLHDPRKLPDYELAKDAILGAKERKELIFVHGDYDVDGVTSAALLNRFLTRIGCQVQTHVPHRMREGYGIHRSAVEAARVAGAKLFLTCDCGIAAHEQVKIAREAGMSVVVTDHHTVGELPDANAVINPHRLDSEYPFDELSGAGVVFRLCDGLSRELGIDLAGYYRAFLDLAALGTIADVMPLVDENRIIARFGLQRLSETKKVGIQALMREAKIILDPGKSLRSYHVGFVLGPRLNAAGRLDDADLALQLLIENDEVKAANLARTIERVNSDRRTEQQRIVDEATEMVIANGWHQRNVIVVGNDSWHSGIVGIVAGRLVDQFHRPTFVVTIDRNSGICKGSARTIPNFNLAEAIHAHPELFLSGGGHAAAAGCSFHFDDFEKVADTLHLYAGKMLTPDDFLPTVRIDVEVDFSEVNLQTAEALQMLEPFGCANPEPVFVARGISLAQILPTKNPAHVRLLLRSGSSSAVPGIAFGIGERLTQTGAGTLADLLFQPNVEEWRGMRSLKLQVKDYVQC
ncbi:single-stranded-DNA-specific exonuclease RecJ [Fimbriimonas ginsengisoli]|uniref:Single-stranded-DNA-specific exonuclease RecJ n=1 Tax=Fimbriimonas ginsengisoli Gsoil 348 TaxID=661478 RepID=A0A068NIY2_FIMGI|nr:single-stranded-DNA-specific exonuclease RecJ [Fimbriimonas ginsengisoli]AIE83427.1 Single-stranded-DNA-specific exonuclease RecJ [Fimbriimonas ginsengisoli Gsoil 348]